jgi:AraC family transcriptional regulator
VLHETRSIIDPPSPRRTPRSGGRDFMELWQARCVQGYIAAHLHSKIKTGDLATATHFKRGQFNRIFKASFGCTPCQYVKRMRVARAQNLMIISSSPLRQIALECGFADQAHFSNCFRRVVGERPAAWRAMSSHFRGAGRDLDGGHGLIGTSGLTECSAPRRAGTDGTTHAPARRRPANAMS